MLNIIKAHFHKAACIIIHINASIISSNIDRNPALSGWFDLNILTLEISVDL